jgi:hypothetical protein
VEEEEEEAVAVVSHPGPTITKERIPEVAGIRA